MTMVVAKEKKKTKVATSVKKKQANFSLKEFITGIRSELKKITWTDPKELKSYTKIVVIATFVFGIGLYFVDVLIAQALDLLHLLFKVIGG